jgi:hypothetical protein
MSKSVSTTLDDKDHQALKALAKSEDRDISGQVRHMLKGALGFLRTLPRDPDNTGTEAERREGDSTQPKEPLPG